MQLWALWNVINALKKFLRFMTNGSLSIFLATEFFLCVIFESGIVSHKIYENNPAVCIFSRAVVQL